MKKDYRRRPEHQALYNSKQWHQLKADTIRRAEGLCERCKAEGFITPGVDCHHIVPWETGRTMEEVKRLFFNPDNLRLLCVSCHIKTHQELRSHKAEQVAEKKRRGAERRASWLDPNYETNKEQNNENEPITTQQDGIQKGDESL